jgi:hypothetical protein
MPTAEMAEMLRCLELRPTTKVDCDQPSNVGYGELRTTDKFIVRKLYIERGEKMLDARTAAFGQGGNLLVGLRPR